MDASASTLQVMSVTGSFTAMCHASQGLRVDDSASTGIAIDAFTTTLRGSWRGPGYRSYKKLKRRSRRKLSGVGSKPPNRTSRYHDAEGDKPIGRVGERSISLRRLALPGWNASWPGRRWVPRLVAKFDPLRGDRQWRGGTAGVYGLMTIGEESSGRDG